MATISMKDIMRDALSTVQVVSNSHKHAINIYTYEGHDFTKDDLPKGCKDFLFDEKTGALKGLIPNDVETIEGTKPADYYYDLEGRILGNDDKPYSKVISRRNDGIKYNEDGIPMRHRSSGVPIVYSDQGIAAVNEFRAKLGMDKLLATDYTSDGIPMTYRTGSRHSAVDMYKAELDEHVNDNSLEGHDLLE